jgi:DNA-binding MarR family transcriptional regulator
MTDDLSDARMTENPDPERLFARRLYGVSLAIHAGGGERLAHAIADSGLSLAKIKLLHILARPHSQPPMIARVAALLGVSTHGAHYIVNSLERQRYVDLIDDEEDARVRRVILAPKGRETIERLDRAQLGQVERFAHALSPAEHKALERAVDELVKRPEIARLVPPE